MKLTFTRSRVLAALVVLAACSSPPERRRLSSDIGHRVSPQVLCYAAGQFGIDPLAIDDAQGRAYSLRNAYSLALLSLLANDPKEDALATARQLGFTQVTYIERNKADPVTYRGAPYRPPTGDTQVIWAETPTAVVVTFRATSFGEPNDYEDVKTDLNLRPEANEILGYAHGGFLSAYRIVHDDLWALLRKVKPLPNGQPKPVIAAGYSLSAGLATLFMADLLKESLKGVNVSEIDSPPRVFPFRAQALYTFGSPRVGDATFATRFDYLVRKARAYRPVGISPAQAFVTARFQETYDPIPTLPPKDLKLIFPLMKENYVHVGGLVYLDRSGAFLEGAAALKAAPTDVLEITPHSGGWLGAHLMPDGYIRKMAHILGSPCQL